MRGVARPVWVCEGIHRVLHIWKSLVLLPAGPREHDGPLQPRHDCVAPALPKVALYFLLLWQCSSGPLGLSFQRRHATEVSGPGAGKKPASVASERPWKFQYDNYIQRGPKLAAYVPTYGRLLHAGTL